MKSDEVEQWLKSHKTIHPKEIAFRVGEARRILMQLLALQKAAQENKRLRENIAIIGKIMYHAGDHEKCAICKMVREAEKESSRKTKIDG